MILITSAKYLADEFQAEFGKITPSFLCLGGKRLYQYQAELFGKSKRESAKDLSLDFTKDSTQNLAQKIVLSLPQSFALSDFECEKIANLGIFLCFVPDNLTLGESIAYCLNMNLPLNEPLQILHGDTFFTDFAPYRHLDLCVQNTLGVSKALYGYEYAKLDSHNFRLKSAIKNPKDFVLNGYFCISSPNHFIKALLLAHYDFIGALEIYSKDFALNPLPNDSWLDFGLISSYFHSKSAIFTKRHFNSISIDSHNAFICKSSHHARKIQAEIAWFEALPTDLHIFTPKIYPNKKSYKCEYLYLNTLAEIFVFGRLNGYAFKIIFTKIAEFLSKIHAIKPSKTLRTKPNFSYKQKSNERLKTFAKQRNLSLDKPFRFNGKIAPSLNDLLDKLEHFIDTDFEPCFMHGDFCFSNIAFDFRALRIKTFDPRGLDFNDNISVYGDKRYDYAKLAHSVLGLYDFIVFGFYECDFGEYEFKFSIEKGKNIKEIQQIFLDLFDFENKSEILAITCHLFLSMLPLHCDDKARQDALLANAYRIYFELLDGENQ